MNIYIYIHIFYVSLYLYIVYIYIYIHKYSYTKLHIYEKMMCSHLWIYACRIHKSMLVVNVLDRSGHRMAQMGRPSPRISHRECSMMQLVIKHP